MLRHTALFLNRDTVSEEEKLIQQKGLAYLRFECPTVKAVDYGRDLFGGSSPLLASRPWKRTPLWRARQVGPACNYDVILILDFDDQAGLDGYNKDETHEEVGHYNQACDRDEVTARIDWWYDGGPLIRRGLIRHEQLFVWDDGVTDQAKQRAQDAVRRLESVPGVELVTIGQNVGVHQTDFDWNADIMVADQDATERLIKGEQYAAAMKDVAAATKYEWTARISHLMRGL